MADNVVSYRIDLQDNATSTMGNFENATNSANRTVGGLEKALSRLGSASFGVSAIINTIGSLWSAMKASEGAYRAQIEVETKLERVMQNTMNATGDDIRLIKDLTAAQQELGVIGDEVQLAGAQELSTYLEKKESLQKLIPVMNDMVAQQYGLNATQESAASIATMMGKVMEGQTSALSRYGYSFTEAQEKILKFGTEEERAATLAEVVGQSVGGMNEALAQTPAGQMQQYANSMGDVQERLGALYTRVMNAMLPSLRRLVSVLNVTLDIANEAITFVSSNLDVIAALAAGITAVSVAANALAIKVAVVTAATKLWTTAQAILNAVLTANPIGLVIAAIAALVAAILWVRKHTEGWGTLWDAVVTHMKESFFMWVEAFKLAWNAHVHTIMSGLDLIRLGWYKFKEAVGMGDSAENLRAIAQINSDMEARKRAISEGANKVAEHFNKARHAYDNVSISWKSSEDAQKVKAAANGGHFGGGGAGDHFGDIAKKSTEAIATGGTRNTQITINFSREMVKMDFNGGYLDNAEQVEATLAESLLRVLNAAKASI
ncbi:MAG: hypothetical protein MJZ81_06505 [Bacteroidales bacterium]|nr:hypothetical protein [Bacteroidales bacterium]